MSDEEKDRSRLTRRGFIQQGSSIGAGIAFTTFVIDLSACSSDANAPAASGPTAAATDASGSMTPAATSAANSGEAAMAAGAAAPATTPTPSTPSAAANAMDPNRTPMAQATPSSAAPADGTTPAATPAAPSGTSTTPGADVIAKDAVMFGLYKGDGTSALSEAAKRLDFSWLKPGDSVLIKVATNSQYKHPTTTSPAGVKGMIAELKARGAGRIIVGDQAGVEHVRNSAMGRNGKTSDMWSMSGMADAVGTDAEIYYFDDHPFDTGYFAATLPDDNQWPRGMYLPTIIQEVDHIIYMPRIAQHILAGLTLGHKSAIGWLRDDSRHDLHNDAMNFYEKYTEVNYTQEIKDRFRMVVTVSEAVLIKGGPDTGTVYKLDPVLVTASTRLANHDAVNSSVLVTLDKNVTQVDSGTMTYSAANAPQNNALFANGLGVPTGAAGPWTSGSTQTMYTAHPFEMGITHDRAIARGWDLSGGKPANIQVVVTGSAIDSMLMPGLVMHGEGMYQFA